MEVNTKKPIINPLGVTIFLIWGVILSRDNIKFPFKLNKFFDNNFFFLFFINYWEW